MQRQKRLLGTILTMALLAMLCGPAWGGAEDWNDANISWLGFDAGLKQAKKDKRPICLIFYTSWCPHCANYSKVFSDPKVTQKSRSFVMVRLDADKNRELSEKYKVDGSYIPRTYFLTADGELDTSLSENRPQYRYFYDEHSPASILGGMDRALQKLAPK